MEHKVEGVGEHAESNGVHGIGEIDSIQNGTAALLEEENTKDQLLDDVISDLRIGIFQYKMLLLAGGGYFAVCSEILVYVFLSSPVKKEWNLDDMTFPWLPFFSGLAGILGSFVFGVASDKYGRQKPFMVGIGFVAVFGLVSAFPPYFWLFILIRSFVSFGNGGLSAVDFVLLLEFLPKKKRGTFMVVITFCGALGAVLAGGLAWWLIPRYSWRVFVGACSAPSFLVFICRLFVTYESPRFLFISGRHEEGMKVLQTIARQNKTTLPKGRIVCPVTTERGQFRDLFSPKLRGRTCFCSLVWFFQSTGYWGVTMYLPEYMAAQGIDPYFNMFTIFIGELPGLCLAMILIEPHMLGRIKCLRFFSFFTAACLIVFAFASIDFIKAVFVIVVYFCMVPIYSILNTFTPEIYPTDVRGMAMAWANTVISIPGLVTPFVGAYLMSSSIPWLYPIVWAGFFFLQLLCTLGLTTETAGRGLEDNKSDNKLQTPGATPLKSGTSCCPDHDTQC